MRMKVMVKQAMDKQENRIERLSPDKLLVTFRRTKLLTWALLAILLHVLVIGGTGYSTIWDWADPSRVTAREEARKKAREEALRRAQEEAEVDAGVMEADESGDGAGSPGEGAQPGAGSIGEAGTADGGGASTPPSAEDLFGE